MGHKVTIQRVPGKFGRDHAVIKSDSGWIGVADPDREGHAASPK